MTATRKRRPTVYRGLTIVLAEPDLVLCGHLASRIVHGGAEYKGCGKALLLG